VDGIIKEDIGTVHSSNVFIMKGERQFYMEYLAHLDKNKGYKQLLKDHLKSVANLIKKQIPPLVCFDDISNDIIREFCYYTGYIHDIGKYSDYFQEYLKNGKDSRLKNHAHISACFLYNFLNEKVQLFEVDDKNAKIITFLYYICTRRHHDSLRVEASLFTDDKLNEIEELQKHLSEKAKDILRDLNLRPKVSIEEFYNYFRIDMMKKNKAFFEYMPSKFHNGKLSHIRWYFFLIYIFSLLIDMDKLDSALIEIEMTKNVAVDRVTDYLHLKHGNEKSSLNERREKARKNMVQVIENMSDEEIRKVKFFTLTAPTGIGKTLSSLQSALLLQKRIKELENYTPKIIVAIPFINIIEQNKMEYENVFGRDVKMIVHHRLADFSSVVNSTEEIPLDKALLRTEAWDGDVILTTFVQFFQSIYTGENRLLKKINKLAGSIVILDEIQSIPQEYMPLIGATLKMIAKYYGTRFILMTATQPKILEFGDMLFNQSSYDKEDGKEVQLLPDYKFYFEGLQRTKFVPILEEELDNDKFIKLFFEKWSYYKSCLIVVNTIKRSIELYTRIKETIKEMDINIPVYYLSTNILPIKRREVIEKVRDLLENNKPVILVSTQTIEAGVDMDFDMAFRDFAPLDSLIQTAGRVNRSGKKGNYLPVYIVKLGKDNQYIYGLSNRKYTEELLKDMNEILECDYVKLAERYYDLALKDGVDDKSKTIWDAMMKLDFETIKEFKMIEDIEEVCDVFVEINEKASALADAFEKVISYDGKSDFDYDLSVALGDEYKDKYRGKLGIYEVKALLKLIESKMSDYIVQIRRSKLLENKPVEFNARGDIQCSLYWVPFQQIEYYYDEDTGFIDKNGKAYIY